jgi:hypothetical protein
MGTATDEASYFNSAHIVVHDGWAHESTVLHGPVPFYANQLFVGDFPSGGYDARTTPHSVIERGRLGTLPFALLSSILVFLWARALFGEAGGLFALLLAALNPLMVGFGALVLVDAQNTAMTFLVLFVLWCWVETRSPILWPCLGVAVGLALSTKYLAVFVTGVVAGTLVVAGLWPSRRSEHRWRDLVLSLGVVGLCALTTMHALYRFKEGFFSFESAGISNVVRTLVERRPSGGAHEGPARTTGDIDFSCARAAMDVVPGRCGRNHDTRRVVVPTDAGILLLFAALVAVLSLPASSAGLPARWRTTAGDVRHVLLSFGYLSLGTRMQLGIRYVLPVYPVLLLWQGSLVAGVRYTTRWFVGLLALTAGVHLVDLQRNWPDLISYYNVSSGGQKYAFLHFLGTNSDFGQYGLHGPGLLHARDPAIEIIGPRSGPRFGKLAIDCRSLRSQNVRWLEMHPVIDHLGASWWVFEVTPEGYEKKLAASGDPDLRRDLCVAYLGAGRIEEARAHLAALDPERAEPLQALIRVRETALEAPTKPNLERLIDTWSELGRYDLAEGLVREHHDVLADSRTGAEARVRNCRERQEFDKLVAVFDDFPFKPGDPLRLELVTGLLRLAPHGFDAFDAFRAHLGPKVAHSAP